MTMPPPGDALVMAAAAAAIRLSQGKSQAELDLLAAFLTCLADNLALISGQLPQSAADGP